MIKVREKPRTPHSQIYNVRLFRLNIGLARLLSVLVGILEYHPDQVKAGMVLKFCHSPITGYIII